LPTTVNLAGKNWLSGMSVQVPSGLPASARVTWCGQFASDSSTLSLGWQWAAAAYSSNANFVNLARYDPNNPVYLNGDLNLVGVKAVDDNKADANYKNSDHAGTPEKYLPFVIGGARGGGGNNFTGGYSGSGNLK
jgi:acyl-homoserine lactone acylase PvdQ